MVDVTEHLSEQKAGVFQLRRIGLTGTSQRPYQPERAHVERSFQADNPSGVTPRL
jgi:hypothetical protein